MVFGFNVETEMYIHDIQKNTASKIDGCITDQYPQFEDIYIFDIIYDAISDNVYKSAEYGIDASYACADIVYAIERDYNIEINKSIKHEIEEIIEDDNTEYAMMFEED